MGEAAELYESIVRHFAGACAPAAGGDGTPQPPAGGSLLDVPPSAVANLCVCYVMGAQNEAAEELLRRVEDETAAAMAEGQGGGEVGATFVPPHQSLADLALGTLYCSKGGCHRGLRARRTSAASAAAQQVLTSPLLPCLLPDIPGNFEFGLARVMRALEPAGAGGIDAPRWHVVLLCLLAALDQAAKHMLVLKDAMVADLLAFLQDVEAAGRGMPVLAGHRGSGGGGAPQQTVASQARAVRDLLMKMHE